MQRLDLLHAVLEPADRMLEAPLSLLRRTGLLAPLQDGTYLAAQRLSRFNFDRLHGLEVEGLEQVPAGGVVLASNHQSWFDVQALACVFPQPIHFMAKTEFRRWPLMRQLVELSRSFYIDRSGVDRSGFAQALAYLDAGEPVALFPEGTIPGEEDLPRSKVEPSTALLRGHTGAVRLAILSGKPLIPVGVSGTSSAFPPEMFPRLELLPLPRREKITLRFGVPWDLSRYHGELPGSEELRRLTDELMQRISALVDPHRQWVPLARITPELAERRPGDERRLGVLLLHGFTSSVRCVDGVIPYLQPHGIPWRMPVLAGHGTVYTDLAGVTSDAWIADASRALDELLQHCDQAVIVGLSMGALVALELAATRPERVAGVVTVAPAMRFTNPLAPLADGLARFVHFLPSPNSFHDSTCATQNTNYPKFATDSFASLVRLAHQVEARLPQVTCPTLILHSRRDQIAAPAGAELVHEKLGATDKELVWFHRSGHEMLLDLEATAVLPLIEEFVLRRRHALRQG